MLMPPWAEELPWTEEPPWGAAFLKAPDEVACLTPRPFSLEPQEISFLFIWCSDLLVLQQFEEGER